MNEYDFDAWPDFLRELAAIIGPQATLALAHRCGGLDYVYLPKEPTESHPWASVLSAEHWAKVVAAYGGQRVHLPRGARIDLTKRKIYALAEQGISHRQIALRAECSQRYVRYVLQTSPKRARVDHRQTSLPFGK